MFEDIAAVYDIAKGHRDYPSEAAVVTGLITACAPWATRLLEVACGTGSLLVELRGYERAGLDVSAEMLTVARQKLGDHIALYEANMETFEIPEYTFDVILCVDGAVGYIQQERLAQTFSTFAKHMVSGGLLIIEPWYTPGDWRPGRVHVVHHERDGTTVIRVGYGHADGSLDFHTVVGDSTGVRAFDESYSFALHANSAVTRALQSTQFDDVHTIEAPCYKRGLIVAHRR